MTGQRIIMNFSRPPGLDDLQEMAAQVLETLPDELVEFCESLAVQIEDFPDTATEQEQELEDPYELVALYKSGKEHSPGVEMKSANDDDVIMLFRRPILDMWCEECEELELLVRQIMIEEIARNFDFSDSEILAINQAHHQGML